MIPYSGPSKDRTIRDQCYVAYRLKRSHLTIGHKIIKRSNRQNSLILAPHSLVGTVPDISSGLEFFCKGKSIRNEEGNLLDFDIRNKLSVRSDHHILFILL